MAVLSHALALAALLAGEPELRMLHPLPPEHGQRSVPAAASTSSSPSAGAPSSASVSPERAPVPYDDAVPLPFEPRDYAPQAASPRRKVGTSTTIFVNFDGVEIGECSPSNSHENCHWLKKNTTFDPWSGTFAQRVAILDAMRSLATDFGIRITGERPPYDEPYMMVVYGGDSVEEEALGRAPAGDCWDDLPNQIAYVFLDGERADWVNGGASTAMHESAHTWGFDHLGLENTMMSPAGDNTLVKYLDGCAQIVDDVQFTPTEEPSCPEINLELCGLSDFQNDVATLKLLFGNPYVDDRAPTLELVSPYDGYYAQGPATFDVILEVHDDLHPQVYELEIAVPGLIDEPQLRRAADPSFEIQGMPVGEWTFDLVLRDAAGNEATLSFDVSIGEDAPVLDDGCACAASSAARRGLGGLGGLGGAGGLLLLLLAIPALAPRRRRPRGPLTR
ncbi:hypothetical protein G6O69_34980 [Pseudenhygromyxa sp. WMMC2535]|uniref:hypothetical protein n=1 Tax=Pseudenhygromyxa sp. WMMC2535 TaxID=2712867 RepID=UPI0015539F12|nr:hypothetical protein [Pseudenhygromyxa sp. WMMC2535]NVB43080.1 hypothetical protein [Pseudenhygromyxa sp. WMMC2535]